MQFRDVFEVDRKPVRDRDQRLYKLFVEAKADARAQAETIQQESARYNLGPLMRTINVPIMALLFLERSVQPRLQFEQGKAGNVKRFEGLADPAAIWMIEYSETGKGTMVKGANSRDIPSHGRIWLDSSNGRVLQTEMISEDTDLRADITVSTRPSPALTCWCRERCARSTSSAAATRASTAAPPTAGSVSSPSRPPKNRSRDPRLSLRLTPSNVEG